MQVIEEQYLKVSFVFLVDSEFESVATQLLKRTQAMLNKYRCLLIEDAMVSCRIQVHFVYGMGFSLLKKYLQNRRMNFCSLLLLCSYTEQAVIVRNVVSVYFCG